MRGKIYPIAIITFQTTNVKELCCRSSFKKNCYPLWTERERKKIKVHEICVGCVGWNMFLPKNDL